MSSFVETLRRCCGSVPLGDATDRTVGDMCDYLQSSIDYWRTSYEKIRDQYLQLRNERDQARSDLDLVIDDQETLQAEVTRLRELLRQAEPYLREIAAPALPRLHDEIRAALEEND